MSVPVDPRTHRQVVPPLPEWPTDAAPKPVLAALKAAAVAHEALAAARKSWSRRRPRFPRLIGSRPNTARGGTRASTPLRRKATEPRWPPSSGMPQTWSRSSRSEPPRR